MKDRLHLMKNTAFACVVAVGAFRLLGAAPVPTYAWRFEKDLSAYGAQNYLDRLELSIAGETGARHLRVVGKGQPGTREVDTCWTVTSDGFPVAAGRPFAVRTVAKGTVRMANAVPPPRIEWCDADGKALRSTDAKGDPCALTTPFPFQLKADRPLTTVVRGVVPAAACRARLILGSDQPNISAGKFLEVFSVDYFERAATAPDFDFGDLEPPSVRRVSPSPTADLTAPVRVRVSDRSGVRRESVFVTLDGTNVTKDVVWDGDEFSYLPAGGWQRESFHELRVSAADAVGNEDVDSAFVCFTSTTVAHPVWRVRDDGVILKDGEPFFPISISSVRDCPLNGGDMNRAIGELKANGFNLVSTYAVRTPGRPGLYEKLVDACGRNGVFFRPEPAPRTGDRHEPWLVDTVRVGRGEACTHSWEIGDDTGMHRTPAELRRDYLMCKAVDPDALTGQADISHVAGQYAPYAPWTDVFYSENYPIVEKTPQADELPRLALDLVNANGDLVRSGAKNRAIVSIVQYFSGWKRWQRFPTHEEVRAMTFLALAHRSRGVSYYTYFSPNGAGAASTRERLDTLFRVTREVAALSPRLCRRDAAVQPRLTVASGPATDAFARPPISFLQKEGGLLVAVNTAVEPVTATFAFADGKTLRHEFPRNGVLVWMPEQNH